jgi:hypothetical protein
MRIRTKCKSNVYWQIGKLHVHEHLKIGEWYEFDVKYGAEYTMVVDGGITVASGYIFGSSHHPLVGDYDFNNFFMSKDEVRQYQLDKLGI